MQSQRHWLLLLLLCICGAIYFPGLHGPMLLDDFPQLDELKNSGLGLGPLIHKYLFSNSGPLGRPVSMFTFILDTHLWGPVFWLWKLTNLLLHLITASGLYWLLTVLLRPSRQSSTQKFWIALFVTAIWMLHPLNVSTVLYTVQRMSILSALFAILSRASYLEGRHRIRENQKNGYAWIALSIGIFLPLSAFSKENGLLIPLYLSFLEWIFFSQIRLRTALQSLSAYKKTLLAVVTSAIVITTLLFTITHFIAGGYAGRPFTLTERLLTELRVMTIYLWQVVAPSWNNLGFFHDDIQVSKGFLTPPSTLLASGLLILLLWAGFMLRKKNPLASFGLLFFFATHLLESTIFPLELMFEHRNYLGSLGILIAISSLAYPYLETSRILPILAALIPVTLAIALFQFSYTWGDSERLNARILASHPDSPSIIALVAEQYTNQGKADQALRLLDRQGRLGFQLQSLVIKCRLSHRIEDSDLEKINNGAIGLIQSYELTGLLELSNQWLDKQCHFSQESLLKMLGLAVKHTPNGLSQQKLWIYQAHIFHQTGQNPQSLQALEAAFKASPDSPMPFFLATEWLLDEGDKERAKVYYQRAIAASDMSRAITAEYISHFKKRITH
jgi:hypothetical protein